MRGFQQRPTAGWVPPEIFLEIDFVESYKYVGIWLDSKPT